MLTINEFERSGKKFLVYPFHALLGQWTGILDAPIGIAPDYPPGSKILAKVWKVFLRWIVAMLGFFFSVEVIEVAEELVEAVVGG